MAYAQEVAEVDNETELLDGEYGTEYEEAFEEFDYVALGIDPIVPTPAKPGSEDKVRVLAARYAAGLPLWHDEDCYDHGPRDMTLDGQDDDFAEDDEDLED